MQKALRRDKSFYRYLARLTAPIALQNLITFSLGLIDTLMVSQLGNTEMAAVTTANVPVFLLISIGVTVWMLFTRMIDDEWMLIGSIALMVILITPLGSNNYVWPALNNLFFVAPVTFWMVYRFVRWGRSAVDSTGRVPFFPAKAMLAALVLMFFVQSIGLLFGYVFLDGEDGTRRNPDCSGALYSC